MTNNTIGEKVKYFRQRSKQSQFELEVEIGASAGSISRIENNLINPTKETLLKIANVIGLDFAEKAELLGLEYVEAERYIPTKFLNQELTKGASLNNILDSTFFEYAFFKGQEYFIDECDSSLEIPSNEVFYIQNIYNWRKVYTEDAANAYHVPKRMQMGKFAKFLLNNCEESRMFQERDHELYRESRLINQTSEFDYTMMIEQSKMTVFLADPKVVAFTVKDKDIISRAKAVFNKMWEANKC